MPGKVFDISLKLADQPGLPPPTIRTNSPSASTGKKNPSAGEAAAAGAKTASAGAEKSAKPAKSPKDANAPAVAKSDSTSKDDEDDEESSAPAPDITLEEAKRILTDYVLLLNNGKIVAVSSPDAKLPN
jgi:hypothetical protein